MPGTAVRAVNNPTPANTNSVHIDGPLSDFATAYGMHEMGADILSPIVRVDKRSDSYHTRTRRGQARLVDDLMGPKSRAGETTYETGSDNYSVKSRGLSDYVPVAMEANADGVLSPMEETTADIMGKLMRKREARVAALYCTSGNYLAANVNAAGAVWSNKTTSTPDDEILTCRRLVPPGAPGSKLVGWCTSEVFDSLRVHPNLLAMKGLDKGMLSTDDIKSFFRLDEMLVLDAEKDDANEGQDASYARIWTATLFGIARVPTAPSKNTSAFSLTFRVNPGIQTYTWDAPDIGEQGSTGIRVAFADDEVVVQNDMAALITGVL